MKSEFVLFDLNINNHIDAFECLRKDNDVKRNIIDAAEKIRSSFCLGGKLLLCGNGGSAADCQHIAAEFVGRFKLERKAMPAIALHCNSSSLTAIGNDYGYDSVFSRQVEAFADPKDVLVGISTSGNSKNVINAIEAAKERGCFTIMLTGNSCVVSPADLTITVPSSDTATIQEIHIFIGHFFAEWIEREIK